MSHTLHRTGTEESLQNDFPMLALGAKDFNREGCAPKLVQILEIFTKLDTANAGIIGMSEKVTADNLEEAKKLITDNAVVHAVFKSEEEVVKALKMIRDADLGISVTVSGLFGKVHACCKEAGLTPNTVNTSLGVWGNTEEKLPKDSRITEVSSMCGHGMVPFPLVESVAQKIKAGKMTPEQAAAKLFKQCSCHIFNPERAARILAGFAEE